MTRFLASRLLFLISISAGTTIIALVEQLQIAKYLSLRDLEDLEDLCTITNIDNASPVQRLKYDTLVEYLKVVFNVSHFYPKMLAERRSQVSAYAAFLTASSAFTDWLLLTAPWQP